MHTPIRAGVEERNAGLHCAPRYHISVDDVFDAFIEVSDRRLSPFEHPFFAFLERLHVTFGAAVDLYVFYRKTFNGRWRTLAEVSESVGSVLRQNQWLRLGPHALDDDTPPYTQTAAEQIRAFEAIYTQLDRFAPGAARSPWVRLHHFSEAYEAAPYFRDRGVEALLTTDKAAVSYRASDAARDCLKERGRVDYGGITLIRSDFRMERLVADGLGVAGMRQAVNAVLGTRSLVVLMTHECELQRAEVREMTMAVLDHLTASGATST